MKEKKIKNLPEVGKEYHFWDDGKTSTSRHYICKCERIITPEEAKSIIVTVPEWNFDFNENEFNDISLYDHWKIEVYNHDWLYAEDTDYFVECSCPKYDEDNLWFIRTKDGGWFSMNVQNSWQGGRLDIDGKIFEDIINEIKEHSEYYSKPELIIEAYNNEKYFD